MGDTIDQLSIVWICLDIGRVAVLPQKLLSIDDSIKTEIIVHS